MKHKVTSLMRVRCAARRRVRWLIGSFLIATGGQITWCGKFQENARQRRGERLRFISHSACPCWLPHRHHECCSICLKTEVNLVRSTLGGLREWVNNNGHSRHVYHPQCIAAMHLVGGSNVCKILLSDSFSVSVFLICLIGLYRKAYICSLA